MGMSIVAGMDEIAGDMTGWRRHLHANPELSMEEFQTADMVAELLANWGITVHKNIAGPGVVGVLSAGNSGRSIALRCELDALPLQELSDIAHRSRIDGKMHACGHDGHTAMLLGAARYLSQHRGFDGTVNFIFQTAEEAGFGARRMIAEGLFKRFPSDSVWAVHNAPHYPENSFVIHRGTVNASVDGTTITLTGKGAHAARPHQGNDPLAAAVSLYTALQTIVNKSVDPLQPAVVNITRFHSGTANNVVPTTAMMNATIRTMSPAVRDLVEQRVREIAAGVAAAFGVTLELEYRRGCGVLVNSPAEVETAIAAAGGIVGHDRLRLDERPTTGGDDFAEMLEQVPGAMVWLGGGRSPDEPGLHNSRYDFNDSILATGASYFVELVKTRLLPTD
jgi:amidohydrolase